MADDNQTPQTIPAPVSDPTQTPQVSPPANDPLHIYHPDDVHAGNDVSSVPQETPLVQANGSVPPPVTPVEPTPVPAPEEVVLAPEPAEEPSAPSEPPAEDGPSPDGEKSPLEILEEILASASAEKEQKDKEEEEKKALAEKEKAEMAAKEAQFKAEAAQKIAAVAPQLEEAKQQRDSVDAQYETPTSSDLPEEMEIKQLRHDTVDQPQ